MGDEPTSNLETKRSSEVLAMRRRLNQEHRQTILVVTYDPQVAASTDRVIHMRDGLTERHEVLGRAA